MDPVSHAVFGAALAMSLQKEERDLLDQTNPPSPYAYLFLTAALTAMAPDLDSLIKSNVDQLLYIEYHRHFTHSFLMIPVISFFVTGILYLLGLKRKFSFMTLWKWGALAVATHGFLDACTSYGTHLLWPFSERRESWSIISIVDPLFTFPLLLGLLLTIWKKKKIFAVSAFIFALLYLLFGVFQHYRARSFYQDQLRGSVSEQVQWIQVKPTIANQWLWRGIARVGESYRVDGLRLSFSGQSILYRGSSILPYTPEKDQEFQTREIVQKDLKRFEFFSEGLLYRVPERFSNILQEERWIGDLRYSLLPHSLDPLWVVVLPEGEADGHLIYQFTRNVSVEKRQLYMKMLKGEQVSQEELDAF